jgi:hypothetical protein
MTDIITKGKIFKEDLSMYGGGAETTGTRKTSTGGVQTLARLDWVGVDVFAIYGEKTGAAIASAIDAIGTVNERQVWLSPGDWTLDANLTIPTNVHLVAAEGAQIDGAFTLTVNGRFTGGEDPFGGALTVVWGANATGIYTLNGAYEVKGEINGATLTTATLTNPTITGLSIDDAVLNTPKINEAVALTVTSTQLNNVGATAATTNELDQLAGKTVVNTADNQTVGGTKNFNSVLQINGTSHATHTGDVTGGGVLTIANAVVSTAKLKTVADTTGSSGNVNNGAGVVIALQDYCFAPNIYVADREVRVTGHTSNTADTTARMGLWNTSVGTPHAYVVRWRYVTATDEPFVYAIQDLNTGEILHLWACDDPPPGYWGLSEKPADFVPPISVSPSLVNVEEIVLFKTNRDFVIELGAKAAKDKTLPFQELSKGYEFDKGSKLFRSKNLLEI